ncbi:MAG: cation transporter, partial [Pseudomonadota bacterium]
MTAPLRLSVDGMSCASCVARVEAAAAGAVGVRAARANLVTGTLEVTLDDRAEAAPALAALRAAGYPARAEAVDHEAETAQLGRATLWAMVLVLPVFLIEMGGHLGPAVHHWVHGGHQMAAHFDQKYRQHQHHCPERRAAELRRLRFVIDRLRPRGVARRAERRERWRRLGPVVERHLQRARH